MKEIWGWLFGAKVVEHRLSDEDRQLLQALQFSHAALFDEAQALCMEMSATRVVLETIAENLTSYARRDSKEGESGKRRPPYSKDNSGKSKGPL